MYGDKLERLQPDLVLSCGDLPFDYLEYIVSRVNVPLLYVPGNHDPDLRPGDDTFSPLRAERPSKGPEGCVNVDVRIVEAGGLRGAGLGGSMRCRTPAKRETQGQRRGRALRMEATGRLVRARGD